MKSIHLIGAGGPAGVGITRCLQEHYTLTGHDDSQWAMLMMECPGWTLDNEVADAVISLPDSAAHKSSFRPPVSHMDICRDKAYTAELLGELAPKTYWLRNTHGAGGAGAQMLSEYLPGDNYSVEFVFREGEILATFEKQRLSYSVKSKTQGIDNRGSSAVSLCTSTTASVFALQALKVLQKKTGALLHGFYGVDLKTDEYGVPKVTEINAGRLLTASYAFFSGTGYNLPLVGMQAYFNEPLSPLPDYPAGWGQIRQVGQQPKLFPPAITASWI